MRYENGIVVITQEEDCQLAETYGEIESLLEQVELLTADSSTYTNGYMRLYNLKVCIEEFLEMVGVEEEGEEE